MPSSSASSSPSMLAASGRRQSSRLSPPTLVQLTSRQRAPSSVPRSSSIRSAGSALGRGGEKSGESRASSAMSTRLPLMGSWRLLPVSRRAVNSVLRPSRVRAQRTVGVWRASSILRRQQRPSPQRLTAPSSRLRRHQPSPLMRPQSSTLPPKAADRARKQPQERKRPRSPPKAATAISPDTAATGRGEQSQRQAGSRQSRAYTAPIPAPSAQRFRRAGRARRVHTQRSSR